MSTLHFELVSPERILHSGEVEAVLLPGVEGDMTVLPGHAPVLAALRSGFLVVSDGGAHGIRILVNGGVADISGAGVTVLAERAIAAEDLTPESIEREILHAQMLKDAASDDAAKDLADTQISQLEEARETLKAGHP